MIEFNSKMAFDIKGMIELKTATHFSETTYTDRAKAFDRFCKDHFPEEEVITESITLCWIKDALDHHARNTAHSRIAFIRTLSSYQKALGKNPYVPPANMLNGKSIFVPYIFTYNELKDLFYQIDISEKGTVFERILFSTYFRLAYTCGLRPYEVRTLKRSNVDLNSGEIRIINSKWNRSRTIVMSDDMQNLAKKYANIRDLKYPECEWFFPSHTGVAAIPPVRYRTDLRNFMNYPIRIFPKNFFPE